tara:strand:- start:111 stop:257 length:147 start_codon:yes stop_codon:yes gene_type:complete
MDKDIVFSITNLVGRGFLIGISFHPEDDKYDTREINLYLGFIGLHLEY